MERTMYRNAPRCAFVCASLLLFAFGSSAQTDTGPITEVVEVTEAAPLMHAQSAELGDVVEHRRVVELPLNGRFFVNLIPLTVGVTPAAAVGNPNNNQYLGARAGQPGVEVNGQRP